MARHFKHSMALEACMKEFPRPLPEAWRVFGAVPQDIISRSFNIFIGVSVGNKHISTDLAREYLCWALQNTREDVLILIADKIDAINWEIYRGYDHDAAERKAVNKGRQIKEMFCRAARQIKHQRPDIWRNVCIATWPDVNRERRYRYLRERCQRLFDEDPLFKTRVINFVEAYAAVRRATVSAHEKIRLSEYILDELPTLIEGVTYRGRWYDLILYPTLGSSGMSSFVLDIQRGAFTGIQVDQLVRRAAMIEVPATPSGDCHRIAA